MDNNNFDPDFQQVKRTYTPQEAGHDEHRKPVSRYNAKRLKRKKVNWGVILLVVLFAVIFSVCITLIVTGKNRVNPEGAGDYPITESSTSAEDTTADNGLDYEYITLSQDEVYSGDLILVNSIYEYKFPESVLNDIVDIESYKNNYYALSDNSSSLHKNVIEVFNTLCTDFYEYNGFQWMQVNSAYRSKQEQIDIYDQYKKDYGEDYAKSYVANPGFSEHHTGLAMDLNINVNGSIYYVESYEPCDWFRQNAKNYGFILRYPDDKEYLTGINFESWHYRYVGTPHSQIMYDMNFCLEEYENYLKNYTYDTKRLGYNTNTGVYDIDSDEEYTGGIMIYYQKSEGKETQIKVPKNCDYLVSGNNVDGFIVTCK